jgi:protoporphyrinogen oxidase
MKKLSIGILGGGATGLAAAYYLTKQGHDVTLLERDAEIGGLAGSVMIGKTPLEKYYHHIFASDLTIIKLIHELGLEPKLKFASQPTGIFYKDTLHPFSSPPEMLRFKALKLPSRLRFLTSTAYLKFLKNWKSLESINALDWSRRFAGKSATSVVWEPLLRGKFGDLADNISMAWLWARIHSRTFQLGYLDGGFAQLYDSLAEAISKNGGKILLKHSVEKIEKGKKGKVLVTVKGKKIFEFDRVIATMPQSEFAKVMEADKQDALWRNRYIGASCFILELKKSFIPYYWLNVNQPEFPFLAVVEHTQMIPREQYAGNHILYVGNYVPRDDWRFTTKPEELLKKYIPYLQKINPDFSADDIISWHFSKDAFAQPVVTPEYHTFIPPFTTSLDHVYLASMAQVYPQDRGQNYAFEMAKEVIKLALNEA